MHLYKKHCLAILMCASIAACSDDNEPAETSADDLAPSEGAPIDDAVPTGDTPDDEVDPSDTTILNGVFIDSAVMGINYSTDTQSGVTDDSGTFDYLAGEQITFSIGSLQFPTIAAQEVISPVDLAAGSDNPTVTTTITGAPTPTPM